MILFTMQVKFLSLLGQETVSELKFNTAIIFVVRYCLSFQK